jgi:hypothetical protein
MSPFLLVFQKYLFLNQNGQYAPYEVYNWLHKCKRVETDITNVVELLITDLVTSLTRDIGTRIEDYILLIIVKFRHVIV